MHFLDILIFNRNFFSFQDNRAYFKYISSMVYIKRYLGILLDKQIARSIPVYFNELIKNQVYKVRR